MYFIVYYVIMYFIILTTILHFTYAYKKININRLVLIKLNILIKLSERHTKFCLYRLIPHKYYTDILITTLHTPTTTLHTRTRTRA